MNIVQAASGVITENTDAGCIRYSHQNEATGLAGFFFRKLVDIFVETRAQCARRVLDMSVSCGDGGRGVDVDVTACSMKSFNGLRPKDISLEVAPSGEEIPALFGVFTGGALNTFDSALAESYVASGWEQKETIELCQRSQTEILDEYLSAGQHIDLISIGVFNLLSRLCRFSWQGVCPGFASCQFDHSS